MGICAVCCQCIWIRCYLRLAINWWKKKQWMCFTNIITLQRIFMFSITFSSFEIMRNSEDFLPSLHDLNTILHMSTHHTNSSTLDHLLIVLIRLYFVLFMKEMYKYKSCLNRKHKTQPAKLLWVADCNISLMSVHRAHYNWKNMIQFKTVNFLHKSVNDEL